MLDDLVTVIETLQKRIAVHGHSLQQNETRTRTALIDPILTALGWDVSDPSLVTPEFPLGGGRVDYALMNLPAAIPAATVEAKKLGEQLDSHRLQMLNYANADGIRYAGLTDGNHWEMYEIFKAGSLDERRRLNLSIVGSPAYKAALDFLLLWRPNLASGQPVVAKTPVLSFHRSDETVPIDPNSFPDDTPKSTETLPTEIGWRPIAEVTPSIGDPRPNAIRIEQGPEIAISRWNQVLIEIAEWLCEQGLLTHQNSPVSVGPSRYLVALTPQHKSGRNFAKPRKISGGMYLELDYTGKDFIRHIRTLLDGLNVPANSVELRFE